MRLAFIWCVGLLNAVHGCLVEGKEYEEGEIIIFGKGLYVARCAENGDPVFLGCRATHFYSFIPVGWRRVIGKQLHRCVRLSPTHFAAPVEKFQGATCLDNHWFAHDDGEVFVTRERIEVRCTEGIGSEFLGCVTLDGVRLELDSVTSIDGVNHHCKREDNEYKYYIEESPGNFLLIEDEDFESM